MPTFIKSTLYTTHRTQNGGLQTNVSYTFHRSTDFLNLASVYVYKIVPHRCVASIAQLVTTRSAKFGVVKYEFDAWKW